MGETQLRNKEVCEASPKGSRAVHIVQHKLTLVEQALLRCLVEISCAPVACYAAGGSAKDAALRLQGKAASRLVASSQCAAKGTHTQLQVISCIASGLACLLAGLQGISLMAPELHMHTCTHVRKIGQCDHQVKSVLRQASGLLTHTEP